MMYSAVDAVGLGVQPRPEYAQGLATFFILWVVFGSFFILNCFVSVIIDNFNDIKQMNEGRNCLTDEQSRWVELQEWMLHHRPAVKVFKPKAKWRQWCFTQVYEGTYVPPEMMDNREYRGEVCNGHKFGIGIMGIIMLNVVVMAIGSDLLFIPVNDTFQDAMSWVFNIIYLIECILKVSAFGFQIYISDGWNAFDFSLVILSIVTTIADLMGSSG